MDQSKLEITLNGSTRLHIIVGDPIAQVKSPFGMTKALVARGENALVVPIHVSPADLSNLLTNVAFAKNLDGIIVTVPHKFACYAHCAETSDRARFLETVQIMRRRQAGGWYGENFDGVGFVRAAISKGAALKGARALLVGAGGAGSAIALALLEAGVRELAVHDADIARRDKLIERLKGAAKVPVITGSDNPSGYDFVGNANPMGMREGDPLPFDPTDLKSSTFVGCVITAPLVSPIAQIARDKGCKTSVGVDMYAAVQELMLEFLAAK